MPPTDDLDRLDDTRPGEIEGADHLQRVLRVARYVVASQAPPRLAVDKEGMNPVMVRFGPTYDPNG